MSNTGKIINKTLLRTDLGQMMGEGEKREGKKAEKEN